MIKLPVALTEEILSRNLLGLDLGIFESRLLAQNHSRMSHCGETVQPLRYKRTYNSTAITRTLLRKYMQHSAKLFSWLNEGPAPLFFTELKKKKKKN